VWVTGAVNGFGNTGPERREAGKEQLWGMLRDLSWWKKKKFISIKAKKIGKHLRQRSKLVCEIYPAGGEPKGSTEGRALSLAGG